MATYVTMLQVYKTARYLLVERCLCTVQASRFLSTQLYTSGEVDSGSSLLADLNFHSVNGLYKKFTRMCPTEFEFLINLIGEKNLEKGHNVQESHFCSRKVGTDATFLGKW